MIFTSLSFIFLLLPLFLALDISARSANSGTLRNAAMLFVSLVFYTWGEAANVFLLLALGVGNYVAATHLNRSKNPRACMALFVAANLAVLIGFKYAHWLLSFILPALDGKKASMPLGISFFTFHAISYLADVYRRHIQPAKTPLDFLTYFCMFPHLVAGPIVRYAQVQDDLSARGPDKALFSFGLYRFLVGLNKKVIIANSVAVMADSAFSMSGPGNLHFFDAWLGIAAYAIQIYFDFSGYSDMAIGLAAMAGFHFEENFRRPYSSTSIREFWRRWHISLSSWLRDYLYIPLGGSKKGRQATYINLLIVFFLCGLWHGANVTFIVWGLWHGLFLVIERLPVGHLLGKMPTLLARAYTLVVVLVGWVFFRAENIGAAWTYLKELFAFSLSPVTLTYHTAACVALAVGGALCLLPDKFLPDPTSHKASAFPASAYWLQALLAVISIALLLTGARNPFIYFDF
ncbi:MBOAT family O-acyltransferase [Nitratidesulfovibrio sp. SRB-5]|uniref:MBOAT family O-acyltransferase n=1 Tax=Nitratidesulfovibrio sp. SRB-5 TaxID=2872636 RepID=UPI0010261AD4|nr:MBOAT family O-acyltransferase [Nitratidesulfovibrio sp. SRB-5]MBZ2170613.1 MBOAT family protein [Nitratidesulfovibrio sp. SRB-5]RXF76485.1 MBOAT family protein [Desulfovibrio sp. DS-1]